MIYDYYLSNANIKDFEEWDKAKKEWKEKSKDEKYKLWLDEIFVKPLAKSKVEIRNKLSKGENPNNFYPQKEDLENLPENSLLIKISFTLKKPYTSKDEGEFHIIDGKIFENPIVRDKFTGLPMIRPSTWKGHLRFAAGKVKENDKNNENEKKKIIRRLFGSEPESEDTLKGRLYFFPTFFEVKAERDVITPLKRYTRTPTSRGPITLEVMKPESKGDFYLLYVPYQKGKDSKEEEIDEDLKFLAEALNLMFYTYGFSAKKTSGFGVIERLKDWIEVYPEKRKETFSILYTKPNKAVKDGA